jgi:hypothetical protein
MEVNMQAFKENVIAMIKNMPQDVSVEDIMAELYFRYEVDQGIKQLDEGKGIPHKEIEKRMKKWLKNKMVAKSRR